MGFSKIFRAAFVLIIFIVVGPISSAFASSQDEPPYEEQQQWCLPEAARLTELANIAGSGHPEPESVQQAAYRAHNACYQERLRAWRADHGLGANQVPAASYTPRPTIKPPVPAATSAADPDTARATKEATAAIDEILAEPEKETARRVAQFKRDDKRDDEHAGEDASFCLNPPVFPANGTDPQRLHNHCSYSIEAMWCVEGGDCKPGYSNLHTFAAGASYPINGTSAQDGGLGRRVQFAACRGVNTFKGLKEPFTFLCRGYSN